MLSFRIFSWHRPARDEGRPGVSAIFTARLRYYSSASPYLILLVDNGSSSCKILEEELRRLEPEIVTLTHDSIGPPQISRYSGVVVSGRAVPSNDSNIHNSRIVMASYENNVPMLGVCFGGEILATTFGATLRRLPAGLKESRVITVIKENKLLSEVSFVAREAHQFRIGTLPSSLERLAISAISDNEAVKHAHAEMYGVQFHPELSGESGRLILANFVRICRQKNRGTQRERSD